MLLLHPRKVFRLLTGCILGLTLANLAVQVANFFLGYGNLLGLAKLFDVNEENSLPTWYSSTSLLLCSLLLFLIFTAKKQQRDKYANFWRNLSIIFLFLSLDETASFHELFIPVGRAIKTSGVLYFFWVVPGLVFALGVALFHIRFLMTLPIKIRHLILAAGAVYLSGCVGLEMLGGYYFDSYILGEGSLAVSTWTSFFMAIILAVEELLEMLGILIFIYALLSYIKLNLIEIDVRSRGYTLNCAVAKNKFSQHDFSDQEIRSEES